MCRELSIPLTVTAPDTLKVQSVGLDGQVFSYRDAGTFRISLLGEYQRYNAITALDIIWSLREKGWKISDEAIQRGLADSKWPGRLELARRDPDFIIDGGHNPQCVDALM